jgi:hypothetical protein
VRRLLNPSCRIGQNRAIKASAMNVLTSPFEKKMPRLPCEASSD